jgi:hypothetical protein
LIEGLQIQVVLTSPLSQGLLVFGSFLFLIFQLQILTVDIFKEEEISFLVGKFHKLHRLPFLVVILLLDEE